MKICLQNIFFKTILQDNLISSIILYILNLHLFQIPLISDLIKDNRFSSASAFNLLLHVILKCSKKIQLHIEM